MKGEGNGFIVSCTASFPSLKYGLVDIDYTIGGDCTEDTVLAVRMTDGDTGRTYVATNFLGGVTPPTVAGRHRITWDTAADGLDLISSNVTMEMLMVPSPYCVIDLSGGTSAASYPVSYLAAAPAGGWTDEYKTTKLVLRRIEAGSFIMGGGTTPESHRVTLTKPFYVGVFGVTQRQWELVMGNNPSACKGDIRPVECVSYNMIRGSSNGTQWPLSSAVDATSFLGKLRAKTGLEGFDLPTEAQWEYACRAGTTSAYNNGGDTEDGLKTLGRYSGNRSDGRGGYTQHTVVGSYLPNAWGLYDMHGNVWEWCLDWYGTLTYCIDTVGSSSGSYRVKRGSGWVNDASICTSSYRGSSNPSDAYDDGGFRLAMTLKNEMGTSNCKNGTVLATGSSAKFTIDTRAGKGVIPTDGAELLRRSSLWHGDVDSTVTLAQDGVPLAEGLTGEGTFAWTAPGSGMYTLTHTTYTNGVVETAAFVVTNAARYCVVDLSDGTNAASYPVSYLSAVPVGGWTDEYKTTKLVLRRIEAGTITGINADLTASFSRIALTKPYYVGVFEVTQKQYELVMGSNPSEYKGDMRPVEKVSFNTIRGSSAGAGWPASSAVDADSFIGRLRRKTGLASFDLPTETQWEYACRAGTTSRYNNGGDAEGDLKRLGRYLGNADDVKGENSTTTVVGSYDPNRWGLYDMHGNVFEWCRDWYGAPSRSSDFVGATSGNGRVVRGGFFVGEAYWCHSGRRHQWTAQEENRSCGFRLSCAAKKGSSDASALFASGGLTVTGWSGTYDGTAHGMSVAVGSGIEGATVAYATTQDGPYSSTLPTWTDVGTRTTPT